MMLMLPTDRLMNACLSFLSGTGLLGTNEEIFSKKPRTDMPWLIVAWIMNVLVLFPPMIACVALTLIGIMEAVTPSTSMAPKNHPLKNGEHMVMPRRCEHR